MKQIPELSVVDKSPSFDETPKVSIAWVARHFSVTVRTVDRWIDNEKLNFPEPFYIGNRKFWEIGDLERWERERKAQAA
jgi:hypothetical protein